MIDLGFTSPAVTPRFVQQWWPLTAVAVSSPATGVGNVRSVREVTAFEGRFVAKVADEWRTPSVLAGQLEAFTLLPAAGFNSMPRLLRTVDNRLFVDCDGVLVYLLEFVPGVSPPSSPATWARLGALTAQLHRIDHYPYRSTLQPDLMVEELATWPAPESFRSQFVEVVKSLPSFTGLPEAVVHTDISPSNTVVSPSGEFVLVDWDDVGLGPRVIDVAFPLVQQFVSEDCVVDYENLTAFYGAYMVRMPLSVVELDHLVPAALLVALRYLRFGDVDVRWRRVCWALEHRLDLLRAVTMSVA